MNTNQEIILWGSGTARTLRPIWIAEELGFELVDHRLELYARKKQ